MAHKQMLVLPCLPWNLSGKHTHILTLWLVRADGQDKDSKPNLFQLIVASVTLALYTGEARRHHSHT